MFARSAILILVAGLHSVAFAAAGILSSKVTTAKSEVLLRSDLCGIWHRPSASNWDRGSLETIKYEAYMTDDAKRSAQFVSECYNTSLANCDTYGRRPLSFTTSTHTSCPFDPTMCNDNIVARLDSGYVDSLYDLGINSHPSGRVAFRKITQCSPITADGFTKTYTSQNLSDASANYFDTFESIEGSTFTAFYYGESLATGDEPTFIFDNSSFDVSSDGWSSPYIVV